MRKKDSSLILASQNIEDFLLPGIREYTKPLFAIPTHQFYFHPGNINPREFMESLQVEESEYELTVDEAVIGKMKTNLGGKLVCSLQLTAGRNSEVRVGKQ